MSEISKIDTAEGPMPVTDVELEAEVKGINIDSRLKNIESLITGKQD